MHRNNWFHSFYYKIKQKKKEKRKREKTPPRDLNRHLNIVYRRINEKPENNRKKKLKKKKKKKYERIKVNLVCDIPLIRDLIRLVRSL